MSTPSKKSRPVRSTFPSVWYTTQEMYTKWCKYGGELELFADLSSLEGAFADGIVEGKDNIIRVTYMGIPAQVDLGSVSLTYKFTPATKDLK